MLLSICIKCNEQKWYFPSSELDFTEEVDSCSGKSVSKGGIYPPRVGLYIPSEARAVIETQQYVLGMKGTFVFSIYWKHKSWNRQKSKKVLLLRFVTIVTFVFYAHPCHPVHFFFIKVENVQYNTFLKSWCIIPAIFEKKNVPIALVSVNNFSFIDNERYFGQVGQKMSSW